MLRTVIVLSFFLSQELFNFSFAQENKESNELIERRGYFEKHFQRPDGKVDMLISFEPINFLENKEWKTISNAIEKNNDSIYEYANLSNIFQSYYSKNIQNGIKTYFKDTKISFVEMKSSKLYFENNGNKINERLISKGDASVMNNELIYKNVYPSIDLKITQGGGKRKVEYIIQSNVILSSNQLNDAKYLVFEESTFLPDGYYAKLVNGSILVFNAKNEFIAMYDEPIAFDSKQGNSIKNSNLGGNQGLDFNQSIEKSKALMSSNELAQQATNILYEIEQLGNQLIIKIKVDINWLKKEDLVYPLIIDPTLTASVAANTAGYYFSTNWGTPYGPSGIVTSGAPANSSITAFSVNYNVTYVAYWLFASFWSSYTGNCGSWHILTIFDNTGVGWYSCGGAHNFNCKNPNNTWSTELRSADGDYYRARYGYTVNLTYETLITPSINSIPVSNCAGYDPAIISVSNTVNGVAPLTYQWYLNGTAISGATSSTYDPSPLITSGTYNYYVIVTDACGKTATSLTKSFTIETPPAATLSTTSSTVCNGTQVNLSGNVTTSGAWTLNLSNGQTVSGTGNAAWNATVTPSASTTYTISSITNSTGCPSSLSGSTTVTLPTAGSALGNNNESATCLVNQNGWIHFYHSSGRLLASINSLGQNLGNVTVTSYVDVTNASVPACTNPNPIYNTSVMQRHWVITPTIQPTTPVQVRLPYSNAEFSNLTGVSTVNANPNDDVFVPTDVKLSKYSGPLNVNANALDNCTGAGGSGGTTQHNPVTNGLATAYSAVGGAYYSDFSIPGFSEFWLNGNLSASPLPVELTSFQANCKSDSKVELTWSTASEHNSSHYVVEKTTDGQEWLQLATVQAAGNSNTTLNYSIIDPERNSQTTYYRLNQLDVDGASKTYDPVSINCEELISMNEVVTYPNPSNSDFYVQVKSANYEGEGTIKIIDVHGSIVKSIPISLEKGITIHPLEDNNFAPGVYYIQVVNEVAQYQIVRHVVK